METQNNNKKTWSKPTVLVLGINKDTYSDPGRGDKETGKGSGNNKSKSIPS